MPHPASTGRRPHRWTLDPLDDEAFPAVSLARRAGAVGGTAPAVFNAANEVAVAAFRTGALPFLGIVDTVGEVLTEHVGPATDGSDEPTASSAPVLTADAVLAADAWARKRAAEVVARRGSEESRRSIEQSQQRSERVSARHEQSQQRSTEQPRAAQPSIDELQRSIEEARRGVGPSPSAGSEPPTSTRQVEERHRDPVGDARREGAGQPHRFVGQRHGSGRHQHRDVGG